MCRSIFTEARLAVKLDPSKGLLKAFIDLNNQVLDRFTPEQRKKIGVHTCPGGDHDSTHSADISWLYRIITSSFRIEQPATSTWNMPLKMISSWYCRLLRKAYPSHNPTAYIYRRNQCAWTRG